jgi:hypothetical protein
MKMGDPFSNGISVLPKRESLVESFNQHPVQGKGIVVAADRTIAVIWNKVHGFIRLEHEHAISYVSFCLF